ncbi:MAG TPA: protein kinase, partial [Gemmataceae bacterium]|nr:protein kinase [Gemmataceae bacterium]
MTEQTIFLSALEIADPTERAAYLEQVCTGDSALRRQVEALLAAHQRSGLFLDEPALEQASVRPGGPSARTVSADEPAGPDTPTLTGPGSAAGRDDDLCFLKPPTRPDSLGRLDRYDIFEVLGRGGFGTVLRAFDDRLHRVVAIKVLAPQLATSGPARQRFHREARAGAAVRDEHVVNIHEVSEPDEPVPYLVMEYVAGQTLQQKLDRTGPLSVPEILRIGSQVAKGLAAAHATGHIHRDIKPSNILLENGVERVKLTDFSLARAVDDASISHSGLVAGTPMYMAPEQAKGERIDHRADLFSLGSVLYAMCTGHSPFRASTTMAVLKRVCEEDPRPVREVNPEVPEWLAAVIAKLHGKKPPDRFQSAKEVAEVLQQHLAHLQQPNLVARPPAVVPPPPSPRRWQAGDRVLAPWEPEWLYPATVQQTNADSVLVTYDDGDSSWQDAGAMRPLDIEPGARVFGWWNGPYYPGTVTAQDGNRIHIAYDDGDSEWTEFDCIRVATAGPAPVTRPAVAEPVDRPLPPALQRLRLPANGLFVTGILYWATLPVVFVARFMPGVPDDAFPWLLRSFGVVPVVAGFVFVFAAWKMRRGELYPLCVAAALLPLALVGEKLFSLAQGKLTISPGDFTALPFGLWALIELTRSDVRAAFGRARLEASGPFRPPAAPPRRRPRWAVAAVVALVLVALGAVFGHAALLYLSDRGELELVSQDGVVSVIVLKNDDGVIDGNKLHPTVTDWLEMKGGHTLKLPPGKYQ